ncbi:MAG: dihydroorotate dehydrogenase electron transfer subunit [Kiritimatiellae bacterium]|nr:dihydroorotate dehydrogenase electron transfer subunit [Kiritimatiellia bacterium]MCO5068429.1 dihydroorotate dehydrogenase electron transfer subunit [Kiritimatiellia bacterium]
MQLEQATVIAHAPIQGSYNLLQMRAPGVAARVQPGQFIHVKVPYLEECILRRPFSIFRAEGESLSILYKDVGKGTRTLQYLEPGESLSILGPLGHGFPEVSAGHFPVLIAGGYGMAALYLVAQRSPVKGVAFFGGRSAQDILCVPEFEALGWNVLVTTEDGSLGQRGLVTDALDAWWAREGSAHSPELFVCGPGGMLKAAARRAEERDCPAWTSVDNNMGCGVGACLTCVLKVKDGESWTWARACREGPVFNSRDILWEELA